MIKRNTIIIKDGGTSLFSYDFVKISEGKMKKRCKGYTIFIGIIGIIGIVTGIFLSSIVRSINDPLYTGITICVGIIFLCTFAYLVIRKPSIYNTDDDHDEGNAIQARGGK